MTRSVLLVMTCLVGAAPLNAQHHMDPSSSPYVGFQSRQIKALSDTEIRELLEGEGMGMALPAEMNGYPGPRHVLDGRTAATTSAGRPPRTAAFMPSGPMRAGARSRRGWRSSPFTAEAP